MTKARNAYYSMRGGLSRRGRSSIPIPTKYTWTPDPPPGKDGCHRAHAQLRRAADLSPGIDLKQGGAGLSAVRLRFEERLHHGTVVQADSITQPERHPLVPGQHAALPRRSADRRRRRQRRRRLAGRHRFAARQRRLPAARRAARRQQHHQECEGRTGPASCKAASQSGAKSKRR